MKAKRELIVTERGKRIAKIAADKTVDEETIDERTERWTVEGRATPAQASSSTIEVAPHGKERGALARFLAERGRPWEQ